LRKRGYDAVHIQELSRKGRSDREQIEYAVEQESCIFTFNVKDFVLLHNDYVLVSLIFRHRFTVMFSMISLNDKEKDS
ncbi:MAG: DUF5615 family PIN-like protein, partial [Pseudanabaena sp. CAN_BIN31]|nr:DUF5615 family PIN-like protein [Pseudanabaena sp. CAN_BIN31]